LIILLLVEQNIYLDFLKGKLILLLSQFMQFMHKNLKKLLIWKLTLHFLYLLDKDMILQCHQIQNKLFHPLKEKEKEKEIFKVIYFYVQRLLSSWSWFGGVCLKSGNTISNTCEKCSTKWTFIPSLMFSSNSSQSGWFDFGKITVFIPVLFAAIIFSLTPPILVTRPVKVSSPVKEEKKKERKKKRRNEDNNKVK